jgi:ribosomal protein S18 acetylase RimI-like enzyme
VGSARYARGMGVRVDEIRELTDDVVDAFGRLLPQLSGSARPLDRAAVACIVDCPTNTVFVARRDGEIIGMLTLVVFPLPSGVRARIEDVVVDEKARGQGVGRALTAAAIQAATRHGVRTLDLTSRPDRVAANRLYERLGFRPRESTVYRFQA